MASNLLNTKYNMQVTAPSEKEGVVTNYVDDSINNQNIVIGKSLNDKIETFLGNHSGEVSSSNAKTITPEVSAFRDNGIMVTSEDTVEKLNKQRADNQSNLAKLGNSIAQTLVNEVALGTAIGISDLFDIIGSSIFQIDNSDYSNEVSKYLEGLQEEFKNNIAPIYRDESLTIANGGLTDFGWWAGNAPSIMSSLTLMLPSAGITKGVSKLGSGLKISQKVNDLAKARAASKISKLEKAAAKEARYLKRNAIHDIPFEDYKATYDIAQADGIDMIHASNKKWAKIINDSRAKKIVDGDVYWKPTDVALAQDRFETGLSAAISRTMENYQEARGVYSQVYDTSISELKSMSAEDRDKFYSNNPEYKNLSDEDIAKDIAKKSSDRTFYLDYINTIFDVIQFHGLKNMYKNLGNARETSGYLKMLNTQAAKSLNKNAAIDSADNISKGLSKTQKVIDFTKRNGRKFWDVVKEERGESIEEAINYIAQEEGTHVGNLILSKDVDNEFDDRLKSYLTNGSLWDSAFWGIMGGIGFHYIGSGFNRLSDKIINNTALSEDKIREKEINDRIVLHNNFLEQLKMIENDENPLSRNEDGSYQKFDGDELQKDIVRRQLEANYAYQLAINAMNAGNTNLLISYLEDDNVKKALVDAGVASSNQINSYVKDIVSQIKNVQDSYLNYVTVMDNMGIQTDVARLIATENTQTDLAIRNLQIAKNQRQNNKNVITNALGNVGIDFNSAQNLYDLRIKIMKLQYLEQRKRELQSNGTYSSKIGIENIDKQIKTIEDDIATNHASEIENGFYDYERQRRIIGFDIKEVDIKGRKVKVRRPQYEKDDEVIKRLDKKLELEGITNEDDRKAKIRQLSVSKNNSAKLLLDIEKISPELHKEMQELSKLAIQEVLFNANKTVTKSDINRKVEIFDATTNKAVQESLSKAYNVVGQMMEKYDADEVINFIDNVENASIKDISDEDLNSLNDALFILRNNIISRDSFVNEFRIASNRIKYNKENSAKGTENGIPTKEEKESHESPADNEEETSTETSSATETTVPSTGGIVESSKTPSVSSDSSAPSTPTPSSEPSHTLATPITPTPSVDEQIQNAKNSLQRIVYKFLNQYEDDNAPTEDEYKEVVNQAFETVREQFGFEEGTVQYQELNNRRNKFIKDYSTAFDSSVPSLGSLIYANSEISSIIDPEFVDKSENKDVISNYINRLKSFLKGFIEKEEVEEIDGKYLISFESLFRYINEGTNDNQISRMLYDNLVDAITHNVEGISDNLRILDSNEGTKNLDNAEKSIETRVKEIFGSYVAQRVDIENINHDNNFKNAFDKLNIGDKVDIVPTNDELNFYAHGARIGRMPIPGQTTVHGHLAFTMNNKGWSYEVYHNGNKATANVRKAFENFLGSARNNTSISYYISQIITKNYKKGSKNKIDLVNKIINHPDFISLAVNQNLVILGGDEHNEYIVDHIATLYKYITYSAGSTIKSRYAALDAWFDNLYNSYKNVLSVYNNPTNKIAKVYSLSDGEFLRSVTEDFDNNGNVTRAYSDYGTPSERIDPNNIDNVKLGFTYFGNNGKVTLSNGTIQEFPCAKGGNTFVGIPNRNGRYSFSRAMSRKVSDCKEPETVKFIDAIKDTFKSLVKARYDESLSGNDEERFNDIIDFVSSLFSEARAYTGLFTKVVYRTDSNGNVYINTGEQNNQFAIQIFKLSKNGARGAIAVRDETGNQTIQAFYPSTSDRENEAKNIGKQSWADLTTEEKANIIDKYKANSLNIISNAFNKLINNAEFSLSKNLLESDINNDHQSNGVIERTKSGKIRLRVGNYIGQEYDTYSDMMIKNNFLLVDTYKSDDGKNFVSRADADLVKQRLEIQFGTVETETIELEKASTTTPVEESVTPKLDDDILEILNADYIQDKGSALADVLYSKNLPGIFTKSQLNILKHLGLLPKNIIFAPERNRRATYFATDAEGYKKGDIVLGNGFVEALLGNKDKNITPNVADAIKMLVHENLHKKLHEEITETDRTNILNNVKDIVDIFRNSLNNDNIIKKLSWYKKSISSGRNEEESIRLLKEHINNFLFDIDGWSDARKLEEFLVESLTDDVLLDYLNNVEINNENEKDTLLKKLFRIFEYIFDIKINKNSALTKELIGLSKYLNINNTDSLFVSPKVEEVIDINTTKTNDDKQPEPKSDNKTKKARPSRYGKTKPIDIFGSNLDGIFQSSVPSMNNMSSSTLSKVAEPQNSTEISILSYQGYIKFECH